VPVADDDRYLDHEVPAIRREAAVTCSKLLLGPCAGGSPALLANGPTVEMVAQVLERLLMVGIADPDPEIRQRVLASLDPRFDPLLAQADNLRSLCIALHDEVFATREAAITVIGRLAHRNPAYVLSSFCMFCVVLFCFLDRPSPLPGHTRARVCVCVCVNHHDRVSDMLRMHVTGMSCQPCARL